MNAALLAAPALVGLVLRLAWVSGELEALVRYATPDDAYYYFQIARSWASGGPPSLDGCNAPRRA